MRETKLTEMQQLFVLHFTATQGAIGNASEAARRAGYSEKTAGEQGRQLLEKPHVYAAITEANRRQISGSMATKAAALLERLVDDEAVSSRVRLEAAKTILDRAGYVAPKAPPEDEEEKPLEALSIDELERLVAKRAAALREVTPAPEADLLEPESSNPIADRLQALSSWPLVEGGRL